MIGLSFRRHFSGSKKPRLLIDFTDSSKYPVTAGGTQPGATFLSNSGLTLTHTTEASGVGMTVEGALNSVITFPTGGSLGTLIQGNIARFSTLGCRKEPQRTNPIIANYIGNPAGSSGSWTAQAGSGAGTDTAVAAPDGSMNATRTVTPSGGSSASQIYTSPGSGVIFDDCVMSWWAKATVGGTPQRGLLYYGGLYGTDRLASKSANWTREKIVGRDTVGVNPSTTMAIATVRAVAEAGFAGEALDQQWFLAQSEFGTQVPSSAIITPTSATGTRNADLWTIPVASVVSPTGIFAPQFSIIPDFSCPYQLQGSDGDMWLWYIDSNNWGRLLARQHKNLGSNALLAPSLGYGAYIAVSIGGKAETIGWMDFAAGDSIDLRFSPMGNGHPLEAWYARNGNFSDPFYLGKSKSNFGGLSMPTTGTMSLLDNGTAGAFIGIVKGMAFY